MAISTRSSPNTLLKFSSYFRAVDAVNRVMIHHSNSRKPCSLTGLSNPIASTPKGNVLIDVSSSISHTSLDPEYQAQIVSQLHREGCMNIFHFDKPRPKIITNVNPHPKSSEYKKFWSHQTHIEWIKTRLNSTLNDSWNVSFEYPHSKPGFILKDDLTKIGEAWKIHLWTITKNKNSLSHYLY